MTNKKYTKRIAATAGSLACIAAAPAASEAGLVTVTGSPVSLAMSANSGTSVTWDIDGVGGGEFRLWKNSFFYTSTSGSSFGGSIQFASDTAGDGQGNGRGLVAPFAADNVQALAASFNVGPTVAPLSWGIAVSGYYRFRNAMLSDNGGGAVIGYDFNYGFVAGDNFVGFRFDDGIGGGLNYGWAIFNFDTVNAIVSITEWTYETLDDTAVHVGTRAGAAAVPEPSSLALLACGAVGLVAYRRRRKVAKATDEAPTELPA